MASNPTCPASPWVVEGSETPVLRAAPLPAAACRLPIVPGPCQKPVTRWAFDAAQGKCITFSYGGCKGNGNQFYSEKECKEYCGAPPLAGTHTLPTPCCAGAAGITACTISCPAPGWGWMCWVCLGLRLGCPGSGVSLGWVCSGSRISLG